MSRQKFHQRFAEHGKVFRAPGRVNLIGEHTDYNEGFVLPAAIDFSCWVAASPRRDNKLVIYSENFGDKLRLNSKIVKVGPEKAGPPIRSVLPGLCSKLVTLCEAAIFASSVMCLWLRVELFSSDRVATRSLFSMIPSIR